MDDRTEPGELGRQPASATDAGRQPAHPSQHVVAAFSTFYREFVPTLVAFLVWQGARLPDASDIVQDTMVKAYHSWERIDNHQAWARRVASRAYARKIASIEEKPASDLADVTPLLPSDVDVAAFEQRHEVLRLLALLPPRQGQVMAWTYDGYNPAEIAGELKMSPEAVRSSLLKARRRLARYLAGGQAHDD